MLGRRPHFFSTVMPGGRSHCFTTVNAAWTTSSPAHGQPYHRHMYRQRRMGNLIAGTQTTLSPTQVPSMPRGQPHRRHMGAFFCRKMKSRKKLSTLRSVNDVTEGIVQKSPMGSSLVNPRKADKMAWISVSDSYYKAGQGAFDWEKKMTSDSCVFPTT